MRLSSPLLIRFLLLCAIICGVIWSIPTTVQSTTASVPQRFIVELESPPIAERASVTLRSADSLALETILEAEQQTVFQALQAEHPTIRNEAVSYQYVLNGFVITAEESLLPQLEEMDGIKAIYPDPMVHPTLDRSLPQINTDVLWEAVGGEEVAGKGIKIAIIDGGMNHDAPMFDGTGWSYPADYPDGGYGDSRNNNGKIIVSRGYTPPNDSPVLAGDRDVWPGENGISHGNHVAGIAGGNRVRSTTHGQEFVELVGVAPASWLMSYRIYYPTEADPTGNSAYTSQIASAMDDALKDGADVVNLSSSYSQDIPLEDDLIGQAIKRLDDTGVFVVIASGNRGIDTHTIRHRDDNFLTVGASSNRSLCQTGLLSTTNQTTGESISYTACKVRYGILYEEFDLQDMPLIQAKTVSLNNKDGCYPWNGRPFAGKAVLLSRGGNCLFDEKMRNAQLAGATAIILYNNRENGQNFVCYSLCDDLYIPYLLIDETWGTELEAWYLQGAEVSITTIPEGDDILQGVRVSAATSRGPGTNNVLKPDVIAPGYNIYSQGQETVLDGKEGHLSYGAQGGSSMAAPHVAGAAAMMRQKEPTWSNDQLRSAFMTTANFRGAKDYNGSAAGPIAMGAGEVDLANVMFPGLFVYPRSISFGADVWQDGAVARSKTFTVTNMTDTAESYTVTVLASSAEDADPSATYTVSPSTIRLDAGQSAEITVYYDPDLAPNPEHNEGYILLTGDRHEAHLPVWSQFFNDRVYLPIILQRSE